METSEQPGSYSADHLDSLLTDAVLAELKRQSENGCLLCSMDKWDEEEWD